MQWMKKFFTKKESISSAVSKIGVYYTTVDKWLRNYRAIGTEAFSKRHTYRTPAQKKPLFSITFLERFSPGYLCPAQNFRCTDHSEDGL
ncbi:MAG: helix-turn-helix domain-containing protein [Anaerobutyricum soehngenii]